MSVNPLIDEAKGLAERSIAKLHFLRPESRFYAEELYEAWDQMQAAAKCLEQAVHDMPDPA